MCLPSAGETVFSTFSLRLGYRRTAGLAEPYGRCAPKCEAAVQRSNDRHRLKVGRGFCNTDEEPGHRGRHASDWGWGWWAAKEALQRTPVGPTGTALQTTLALRQA